MPTARAPMRWKTREFLTACLEQSDFQDAIAEFHGRKDRSRRDFIVGVVQNISENMKHARLRFRTFTGDDVDYISDSNPYKRELLACVESGDSVPEGAERVVLIIVDNIQRHMEFHTFVINVPASYFFVFFLAVH